MHSVYSGNLNKSTVVKEEAPYYGHAGYNRVKKPLMTVCMTCNHCEKVTVVIGSRLQGEGEGQRRQQRRSVVREPAAKAGGHGLDSWQPAALGLFVPFPGLLYSVDEMKGLWCSI